MKKEGSAISSHQIQPETSSQLIYREDHPATRWPLVVQGTVAPIVTIGFIIVMNLPHLAGLGILGVFTLIWTLLMTLNLAYSLPVGIRIDRDGIEFGGMTARDRRRRKGRWPPRRPFTVGGQSRAVFSCPWEGVRALYLITDTEELKPLYQARSQFRKSYDGTATPLGFLRFYSMKAALVIVNDPRHATSDPPEFRSDWRSYGKRIAGVRSVTWLVPTRQPEALRAALAQVPGAPPVQDHFPPGTDFQFRAAWPSTR
jgi:hypothetical protein